MMAGPLAARWLLTAVFAAAGLAAVLPQRGRAGSARPADRFNAVLCPVMCVALTAMTWRSEPAPATWFQAALFGCAALWFVLASLHSSGRLPRLGLSGLHHALTAVAMIWMLTAMRGGPTPSPSQGHGAMAAMPGAGMPTPDLVISILFAAYCAVAALALLAQAIGPGPRVRGTAAASQAMMNAGMAAMLLAML
jgi:hypothetical protein